MAARFIRRYPWKIVASVAIGAVLVVLVLATYLAAIGSGGAADRAAFAATFGIEAPTLNDRPGEAHQAVVSELVRDRLNTFLATPNRPAELDPISQQLLQDPAPPPEQYDKLVEQVRLAQVRSDVNTHAAWRRYEESVRLARKFGFSVP